MAHASSTHYGLQPRRNRGNRERCRDVPSWETGLGHRCSEFDAVRRSRLGWVTILSTYMCIAVGIAVLLFGSGESIAVQQFCGCHDRWTAVLTAVDMIG